MCETLTAAGVTPIYSTFKDPWTIAQGHFDYSVGGTVDTTKFFNQLKKQGTDVGPGSPVSFEKQFLEPIQQMQELVPFSQDNAASRGYGDGNLAFANGEAAMYLQGPWAIGEIAKSNPDLDVGAFPLPMTDDPADRKVRVNIDLALWIPEGSTKKEAAREFLSFLMRPDVIDAYNAHALGFGVTKDAAPVTNATLVELKEYYDAPPSTWARPSWSRSRSRCRTTRSPSPPAPNRSRSCAPSTPTGGDWPSVPDDLRHRRTETSHGHSSRHPTRQPRRRGTDARSGCVALGSPGRSTSSSCPPSSCSRWRSPCRRSWASR